MDKEQIKELIKEVLREELELKVKEIMTETLGDLSTIREYNEENIFN